MVRFLHTADLQIGMPFRWADERARQKLREYREQSIETLGDLAERHEVDFVVVAGDFFDANTVGDDVIMRACRRLGTISVPVYILPGNHDFAGGPDSVYQRETFVENKPPPVRVLDRRKAYPVQEAQSVILAAPLRSARATGDTTSHIRPELGREEAPDAVRIGLAHGGVVDFSEGEAMNRIDPERAAKADLDYLALGDWHGLKQVGRRTWYSGTPEPTGFLQNDPGHVLLVEVEAPGALPRVEALDTALWTYRDDSFLPHGTASTGAPERQPVYLTSGEDNPNGAAVRFLVDGAEAGDLAGYERAVYLFDGRDVAAVARAREQWSAMKQAGHAVTYWQQNERGKWEKKA
jgi:DNA polymerase IIIc chi subunit